ncbi:probable protein phosphatase 2C 67 isoform X1 [Musa acuminata AAA Group]|uniref:probable protein phosphatase 2C 67 isoform X1 n=1 Tax=Musa acuminata AAA Group TaxID=214697 RepID=UPI0031E28B14
MWVPGVSYPRRKGSGAGRKEIWKRFVLVSISPHLNEEEGRLKHPEKRRHHPHFRAWADCLAESQQESGADTPQQGSMVTCIEADAAEDKGSRHTMEDASVVLLDASLESPGKLRCAHFAVYDGHGGCLAAEYAQRHLHANVLAAGLPRELMDIKAAKKAIFEGFRRTDESLLQESAKGNWQDGATAVCVWVLGEMVLVANIGDAKAVLARSPSVEGSQTLSDERGSPLKAIVVTREHKAIYPQERARIQKTGGSVGSNGRLQGRLEVSRAFGDRQFKKFGVISSPDVHSFELTEREHFMILGCDGLWGVFGPSDAVDFVQKQLKETSSATTAARRLVREAIRERRCKDNCTAIVIMFKHERHS